jgi:site-specific DNA-methyltransferase (adenine-specific)
VTSPRWEIRQGDALDVLRSLEPRSVSAVVMDPPYCSGGSTETTRRQATSQGIASERMRSGAVEWFAGDNMTTPGLVWLLRSVAFEAERLLVPGGSVVVFCDWRMWANLAPAVESGGLRLQNMIVWDKGSAGMGTGFKPTHELAIHLCNGPGKFHDLCGSNVLRFGRVRGQDKDHPTQKPVDLLQSMIRVVAPRDGLVVDPFCGSGSTGVDCLREGRRFLGIERDPEFCDVSRSRLSGEAEQRPLFAPEPTNPEAA